MRKIVISSIFIFLLACNFAAAAEPTTIYFFYGQTCPHCAKEKTFLASLEKKYPSLIIEYKEVYSDKNNYNLFSALSRAYGIEPEGVPSTFIGNFTPIVGYLDDQTSGKNIEDKIKVCLENGCIDPISKLDTDPDIDTPEPVPLPEPVPDPIIIKPDVPTEAGIAPVNINVNTNLTEEYQEGIIPVDSGIKIPTLMKLELSEPVANVKLENIKVYNYIPSVDIIKEDVPESSEPVGFQIETKFSLLVEEDKLMIEAGDSEPVEVGVKPEQAVAAVSAPAVSVGKVALEIEEDTPVYSIELKQKARLLGLIPVQVKTEVKVSGKTGEVIAEKKPWWSFFVTGLNKFI